MIKKSLLAAVLLVSSSSALAALPCTHEATLVEPDLTSLNIKGLAVQGKTLDISLSVTPSLDLRLISATETGEVNPGNNFDEKTGTVSLDCVSFLAETYSLELSLVQTEPTVDLTISRIERAFNPSLNGLWNINYSSGLASERISFEAGNIVIFPDDPFLGNAGIVDVTKPGLFLDFAFSEFNGTEFGPGGSFSGTYIHKGESGTFEALPISLQSRLGLNKNRFQANVTWQDADGNSGEGQAIQLTDDSGSFSFFDSADIALKIRILERCKDFDSFWVFILPSTNVKYDLQITDTQTNETKIYSNPLGTAAPAITDTGAFATCP